jgi:hypothetical protein
MAILHGNDHVPGYVDTDASGTHDAAAVQFGAIAHALRRRFGGGSALHLSPDGTSPSTGTSMLRTIGVDPENTITLWGPPVDVTQQVERLAASGRQFDYAVCDFLLHHFSLDQIMRTLAGIRQQIIVRGTFILCEYTLKGVDDASIPVMTDSALERRHIQQAGGFPQWIEAHKRFTRGELVYLCRSADLPIRTAALQAARTIGLYNAVEDVDPVRLLTQR